MSANQQPTYKQGEKIMKIFGYQKTTLLDYPEHVAATVFTGGCNFRCPYCHNPELVFGDPKEFAMDPQEIFAHLNKRKGILDGVCITGGEPTLQPDLEAFIRQIKEMGYAVKLDTNGFHPTILKRLLDEGLLDYVAMDLKATKEKYGLAVGIPSFDVTKIEESVEILLACKIPYEFRTTVVKGIHELDDFEEMAKWIAGCRAYYLQQFRDGDLISKENGFAAFEEEEMREMANICKKYIEQVSLRGVDPT